MDVTDNGTSEPDDVDVESDVNSGLNLSPRSEVMPAKRRSRRRWGPIVVLVLVVAAGRLRPVELAARLAAERGRLLDSSGSFRR